MNRHSLKMYLSSNGRHVNRYFLGLLLLILTLGTLAFFSASFGLLSRDGPPFSSVIKSQVIYGLLPGLLAAYVFSKIHYALWRKVALYGLIFAIFLNLLLLIPELSFEHGGAVRWLKIGSYTFQPSEFLKIAFILYLASWLSTTKEKLKDVKFGILPFILILGVTVTLLIIQRDTDTAVVLSTTALIMYFAAGARIKDILIVMAICAFGLVGLFFTRPYLMDRMQVFLNPSHDPAKSGYQVTQSLVAIGSGQLVGRGFGQSIQKYSRLPEPIGDSIYAVIGEEFGFLGSVFIIVLFFILAVLGMRISIRAPDSFGRLTVLGIVIMITVQSFVNMASMLGLIPISGLPLIFVSQGGTSLLAALAAVGIVLNVSRYSK